MITPITNLQNVFCNFFNTPCALLSSHHDALQLRLKAYNANPFQGLNNDEDGGEDDELDQNPLINVIGNTAVVSIAGTLVNQCSDIEAFLFDLFSLDNLRATLRQVASNDGIKNVVLSFASGGGSVIGIEETADLINQLAKTKGVYSYTNSFCCSAAYFLASQASGVFASQSAITGAIGVYSVFMDVSKMFADQGVQVQIFKAGDFKGMGTAGLPLSPDEKAIMQKRVDDLYNQFTAYVRAKRPQVGMNSMQGLTYPTADALKLGLVDGQINDISDLVDYLNQ